MRISDWSSDVCSSDLLLSQPRILLLDEPLSNLDQDHRDELIPYLQRVRDETALPIIYVSHSADEVERLTREVHTLDRKSAGQGTGVMVRVVRGCRRIINKNESQSIKNQQENTHN